jgi:Uma2 family endonuclease
VGVPIDSGPVTVERFYAFTDTRPDEKKWELIDGELVLNEPPTFSHQRILGNMMYGLALSERKAAMLWVALHRFGVWISDTNRPQADLMILPRAEIFRDPQRRDASDVIAIFEILSPETAYRDLRWKRAAYASIPSLTDYAVIAQDAVDVIVYARDAGFAEGRIQSLSETLDLSSIGVSLPLSEIYRDMDWLRGRPS